MKTKLMTVLAVTLLVAAPAGALAAKPKKPAKPAKAAAAKPAAVKPAPPKAKPKGFEGELAALGITCDKVVGELQGASGGAGDGFLAVAVLKAAGGKSFSTLVGKQVALRLLPSTKIDREGSSSAKDLKSGDRLVVQALSCSQGLVAKSVNAKKK